MKLSKNFTLDEFTHSQMAIERGILNEPDAEQREAIGQLVDHLLQPLRERIGEAIAITSGFRNQEVNRLVGGVPTSQHTKGEAADCYCASGPELSLVTDAYSKKIMGYDLSDSLDTQGSLNALRMANRNRLYRDAPLIHHSDRGIQYCSDAYQKLLGQYHIIPSMTESYDPYANAVAERINGILKQEFQLEELNLSLSDMKQVIKDAVFKYNNIRPHYSCGYKTPEYMHHQKLIKIKSYKNKQFSKTNLAEL